MSRATKDTPHTADLLKLLYSPIEQELDEAERLLHQGLRSEYELVDEMVKHGCLLGGKRLRPALLLLVAKAIGHVTPAHITLAAVVEMIHTATLIHDDVLDEAKLRRHLKTCNARWDNEASILLGDYLFTQAFYLTSTLNTTYACRRIGQTTNTVCEGELRQVRSSGNFKITEAEYFSIIEAKTASLCACSCELGAHFAEASPVIIEALGRYGLHLGIAFQLIDDLLDVLGTENDMGKSLGTDLAKRKPTLPMIHVMQKVTSEERQQLGTLLFSPDLDSATMLEWFERFDALEYTKVKAQWHVDQALESLMSLDENPATEVLRGLPEFVVRRSC